jgi:hypothetical protein
MENYNNELYHFGVKGMKWGVRRGRKNSNTKKSINSRASKGKSIATGLLKGSLKTAGVVGISTLTAAGVVAFAGYKMIETLNYITS